MQAELEALEMVLGGASGRPPRSIGGSKVSSKLDVLGHVLDRVDALVIGGGMANTFLIAKAGFVGKSLVEQDLEAAASAIMAKAADRNVAIVMPSDAVVAKEFEPGALARTVPIERSPRTT